MSNHDPIAVEFLVKMVREAIAKNEADGSNPHHAIRAACAILDCKPEVLIDYMKELEVSE